MKKIILTIKIIILLLTIFFLTKVAAYENTVLILNQYAGIVRETPTFDRDEALLVLKNYDMEDNLYVKELLKINNTWIGDIYNYKEAYEKNYLFKWGEGDQSHNNPNFDEKEREKEYNKNTGYFIIENNTRIYGLSKEEVEKKLNISPLKLKSVEIYMKKYGRKGILKKFYRDFFIALYKDKDYDAEDFMKDDEKTAPEVRKLIISRNIMIAYLGIVLISYLYFILKKNINNILESTKIISGKIKGLFVLDFIVIISYFFLMPKLYNSIKILEFTFWWIVVKNFLLYYYIKKDKLKILLGLQFLLFIILITITIKFNIKLWDGLYYIIYFISLFSFTILLFYKKEKIENILILSSSYIVQQCLYFFIISKLFLILS